MSLAATGATGSYPARLWRLCVMAAALSLASAALAQGATAVRQLASPALAVKAGRQRGLSVLEKRRQEEQQHDGVDEGFPSTSGPGDRCRAPGPSGTDPG